MDRRTFLLATAASLAATPTFAAVPRLSEYTILLGNREGSATNVASGISLRGGNYDDPASGVRLFRKTKVKRSGKVKYELIREIEPTTTTSNGAWFNVGLVWKRNPATLNPGIPNDDVGIAPLFKGFRIAHANTNTVTSNLSNKIRLRTYPSRTDIRPREPQVTDKFDVDVLHKMELVWNNGLVTLYDRTMGLKQSFKSTALKPPTGGAWLMWYCSPGTGYRIQNVAIS
jgi:hypothetical protein